MAALFLAVVEQGRLEMAEEKARTEAAVKAGLATFNGRLKAAVRAGLVAAEKAKAESAKRARQEASEKARLEEAEAARQEAAERARQDAAVKAWLEEAENAKRAAAQAARIARNSNKARRTKNSKVSCLDGPSPPCSVCTYRRAVMPSRDKSAAPCMVI